jgi:hypothetical protein
MRHLLHSGLVKVLQFILRDAYVPATYVVVEAMGLHASDCSRPGDVVALDCFAIGRHLAIDAVMTSLYRNTVLPRLATILR